MSRPSTTVKPPISPPAVLVREMAEYEKLTEICVADEELYGSISLFGTGTGAEAYAGEIDARDGRLCALVQDFFQFPDRRRMWFFSSKNFTSGPNSASKAGKTIS